MWTVLWTEHTEVGPIDRWDRFETKAEMVEQVRDIAANSEACSVEDVIVFSNLGGEYTGEQILDEANEDTKLFEVRLSVFIRAEDADQAKMYMEEYNFNKEVNEGRIQLEIIEVPEGQDDELE